MVCIMYIIRRVKISEDGPLNPPLPPFIDDQRTNHSNSSILDIIHNRLIQFKEVTFEHLNFNFIIYHLLLQSTNLTHTQHALKWTRSFKEYKWACNPKLGSLYLLQKSSAVGIYWKFLHLCKYSLPNTHTLKWKYPCYTLFSLWVLIQQCSMDLSQSFPSCKISLPMEAL